MENGKSKTTWMHICEGSPIGLDAHYSPPVFELFLFLIWSYPYQEWLFFLIIIHTLLSIHSVPVTYCCLLSLAKFSTFYSVTKIYSGVFIWKNQQLCKWVEFFPLLQHVIARSLSHGYNKSVKRHLNLSSLQPVRGLATQPIQTNKDEKLRANLVINHISQTRLKCVFGGGYGNIQCH